MLWTFGEVREGRGDEETMMRGDDKKKRNNVPLFFADRTRLISPLSPILCSRLYSFNYLANK